jgi:uncharacterized RDD family membrane protein YckC
MSPTTESPLDLGSFRVETPEQVAFRMERAGLGTRCVATIVDTVCLAIAYTGVALASVLLFGAVERDEETALVLLGIVIVVMTFLVWGYYIAFEIAWNGQTPGKRWVGIRVVEDGGAPATAGRIVVRNLLRFVDMQFGYGVGAIAIFASKDEERLGDLAAGTTVIRERRPERAPLPAAVERRVS